MNYGGDAADQIVQVFLGRRGPRAQTFGYAGKASGGICCRRIKDQKKTRGKTRMVRMLKENKPLKFLPYRPTA